MKHSLLSLVLLVATSPAVALAQDCADLQIKVLPIKMDIDPQLSLEKALIENGKPMITRINQDKPATSTVSIRATAHIPATLPVNMAVKCLKDQLTPIFTNEKSAFKGKVSSYGGMADRANHSFKLKNGTTAYGELCSLNLSVLGDFLPETLKLKKLTYKEIESGNANLETEFESEIQIGSEDYQGGFAMDGRAVIDGREIVERDK